MEKHYENEYIPSRGVLRACGGIVESVDRQPYCDYVLLAGNCVGRGWNEEERERLVEAIRLNLINRKLYPFEALRTQYALHCDQTVFRRELRKYVRVLSGLCGFE